VLLPKGKDLVSIPIAKLFHLKGTYENLKTASGNFANSIKP